MKGLFPRIWRWTKRIFIILFIAQFVYIIILKWVNPPVTITQLVSWVSGHGLKRDYVSRSEMSPNIKLAVIASEDQLFAEHGGFDWKSIKKAMDHNDKKPEKVRGASTISQQVAKNVFLWQGRDWIRKGLEVYFTYMIELVWGKERILEVYLNVIEMGDGIFGIEKASNIYFNKSAANLNRQEAAMIAACLPSPKRIKVKPPSSYTINRSRRIMQQMSFLFPVEEVQEIIGVSTKKKK